MKKNFRGNIKITDSSSRVKMHKSGKHWVSTIMSHFHILKNMKGNTEQSVKTDVFVEGQAEHLNTQRLSIVKGLVAASTLTGAAVVATTAVEAEDTTNTALVNADSITVSTTETISQSGVISESTTSDSESLSQSDSNSLSSSEETSTSVLMSTSGTSTSTEIGSQTSTSDTQSSESTTSTSISTSTATSTSATSFVRPQIRAVLATGQVNNDLVTVTSATVKDSGYSENDVDKGVDDGTVNPHDGESLEYTAKFTIDNKATAGDKFTFTYSP